MDGVVISNIGGQTFGSVARDVFAHPAKAFKIDLRVSVQQRVNLRDFFAEHPPE